MDTLRVVTYNVHKCRGLDRRVIPDRIAAVLKETGGDVIALQEVLSIEGHGHEQHQARCIAEALGMDYRIGENRRLNGGAYGNVTLSRLPLLKAENFDITWRGRERRGALRTDFQLKENAPVHVFNIHLGTAYIERRFQGRKLVSEEILNHPELAGPRIIVGDFNEWTNGLASRLLASHFKSADLRYHLSRARTYPGILPLVHLDHVYYDDTLELKRLTLHRSRTALIASDHLPLVADFALRQTKIQTG
ncbi:MAG: endonuclease/exonuclease/phosphatase family protein [Pyrinomonadaceae bacterium]|nr:endonuclease/exonuclease/phosphatase family protein [Pyrinomonadaceae bacterium]